MRSPTWRRWTPDEDDLLRDKLGHRLVGELASHPRIKRTESAVAQRARKLGLSAVLNAFTQREICAIFSVHPAVALYWSEMGLLQAHRGIGHRRWYRVRGEHLEEFITRYPYLYDYRKISPTRYPFFRELAEKALGETLSA